MAAERGAPLQRRLARQYHLAGLFALPGRPLVAAVNLREGQGVAQSRVGPGHLSGRTALMPGRLVTALIVLFWVGMGVWFVLRDAWPRLDPDEPPRLMVDLVEEGGGVQHNLRSTGMQWFVE